jgi:hypothetical protein
MSDEIEKYLIDQNITNHSSIKQCTTKGYQNVYNNKKIAGIIFASGNTFDNIEIIISDSYNIKDNFLPSNLYRTNFFTKYEQSDNIIFIIKNTKPLNVVSICLIYE